MKPIKRHWGSWRRSQTDCTAPRAWTRRHTEQNNEAPSSLESTGIVRNLNQTSFQIHVQQVCQTPWWSNKRGGNCWSRLSTSVWLSDVREERNGMHRNYKYSIFTSKDWRRKGFWEATASSQETPLFKWNGSLQKLKAWSLTDPVELLYWEIQDTRGFGAWPILQTWNLKVHPCYASCPCN